MKISLNWIKDYLNFDISPSELSDKLTLAGLEVEKLEQQGEDYIFDIEVTPNRADCLNMIGIAREISAILNKPLKEFGTKQIALPDSPYEINIEDKKGCKRYIGVLIEGVEVKESPDWLKEKLASLGMKSINNVVDITNFCLMETGQPLHAFDADKISGNQIRVRKAIKGESLDLLDGTTKELDESMLVIADSKNPLALAGVMGGKDSEVRSETKNILLESAFFDAVLIRKTSKKTAITTDSSYRFERGVDYNGVDTGSKRAVELILELSGGKIVKYSDAEIEKNEIQEKQIKINHNKIIQLIGADLSVSRCEEILSRLEFKVEIDNDNIFSISPPTFRKDIKQDVDIVEEIARVEGYNNLPTTLPSISISNVSSDKEKGLKEKVRSFFAAQGFNEIITYSLISENQIKSIGLKVDINKHIKIKNAISNDYLYLRPEILPSFLVTILNNFNKGQKDLKLFEFGKKYLFKEGIEDSKDVETEYISFALAGAKEGDWRKIKRIEYDYYNIKAITDYLLAKDSSEYSFSNQTDNIAGKFFEQGCCEIVLKQKKIIGFYGKVSIDLLESLGFKETNVLYGEILSSEVMENVGQEAKYKPISEFPAIIRDISILIDDSVFYRDIKCVLDKCDLKNLKSINFIDQYKGENIPKGKKSITISLFYQSDERTLTDSEVNEVHKKACKKIEEVFEVVFR